MCESFGVCICIPNEYYYWKGMLDKGALIFWEAFDPDKEEKSITSFL
jgi:hypothetical protein